MHIFNHIFNAIAMLMKVFEISVSKRYLYHKIPDYKNLSWLFCVGSKKNVCPEGQCLTS